MIASDSGGVGGVLISVVVDHERGVSLPCLLYQMLSGLCVIPVVLPPHPPLWLGNFPLHGLWRRACPCVGVKVTVGAWLWYYA